MLEKIANTWLNLFPEKYSFLAYLIAYTILIALYSLFIWKFYKFLARKDIIQLNLWQYDDARYPVLKKFVASILYLIKYIIILPFIIFFWYVILCLFLLMIAKTLTISNILLIGMAVVGAIRITSYFNEDLSKDLSKMFPFTLLAVFIVSPGFFSFEGLVARASDVPLFFQQIVGYIIFVVALEFIMRSFSTLGQFFVSETEKAEQTEQTGAPIPSNE